MRLQPGRRQRLEPRLPTGARGAHPHAQSESRLEEFENIQRIRSSELSCPLRIAAMEICCCCCCCCWYATATAAAAAESVNRQGSLTCYSICVCVREQAQAMRQQQSRSCAMTEPTSTPACDSCHLSPCPCVDSGRPIEQQNVFRCLHSKYPESWHRPEAFRHRATGCGRRRDGDGVLNRRSRGRGRRLHMS